MLWTHKKDHKPPHPLPRLCLVGWGLCLEVMVPSCARASCEPYSKDREKTPGNVTGASRADVCLDHHHRPSSAEITHRRPSVRNAEGRGPLMLGTLALTFPGQSLNFPHMYPTLRATAALTVLGRLSGENVTRMPGRLARAWGSPGLKEGEDL